ncbi:MAG: serine protease [Myxococcota bacterium]|jgi:serine protease
MTTPLKMTPLLLLLGGLGCAEADWGATHSDIGIENADAEAIPGRLVVDLQDWTSLEDAREATGLDLEWVSERTEDEALAVVDVPDLAAAQDALEGHPLIEAVEPSLAFEAFGFPDDPLREKQWNFDKIGAEVGWRVGAGRGVIVAVIDTGVTKVADLNNTQILDGVSFVKGADTAADDNGHGTHVAGTIAQSTNNSIGVTGLAPEAIILPIKVLSGSGSGRSEWVAAGIDEAVDQGAEVINLSLGGPPSRVIQNATKKAVAAGVIVVAAAGNSGRKGVSSPASVPGVIAVSATGPDDELAPYSSWGNEVSISAPGGNKQKAGGGILQDTISTESAEGHAFREFQGTSMATPHVAGAAAILLSAGAGSPQQVKDILMESSLDLGEPGPDPKFGHGRLDIASAVKTLSLREHGGLFGFAAIGALLLGLVGRMRRKRLMMAATAGLVGGGLFFMPMLPFNPHPIIDMLAMPFLNWPGGAWAANPLWLSALLPISLTFFLAPVRFLSPIVAGFAAGIGAHLLHGAFSGSLDVLWLSGMVGQGWLALNGVLSLLCALAGIGLLNYQDKKAEY